MHGLPFDKSWTLFLDRDGVINQRIIGGYVRTWDEFIFIPGVLEALSTLSEVFGKILVVSNQQGVGKGLMEAIQVDGIHERLKMEVEKAGGRIDGVYFSPHLESVGHPDRKPGTGMALKAKEDFPGLLFERSVMAGDSITDMQFGRNIGAVNILIAGPMEAGIPEELYDFCFPDLLAFSKNLFI